MRHRGMRMVVVVTIVVVVVVVDHEANADDDSRLDRYAVRKVGSVRVLVDVLNASDLSISL